MLSARGAVRNERLGPAIPPLKLEIPNIPEYRKGVFTCKYPKTVLTNRHTYDMLNGSRFRESKTLFLIQGDSLVRVLFFRTGLQRKAYAMEKTGGFIDEKGTNREVFNAVGDINAVDSVGHGSRTDCGYSVR